MTFIVYAITTLLAVLAAARPVSGIALVLALTPFGAVELNVGASMLPSEFVALVTVVSGIVARRGLLEVPPWGRLIFAFLLLSSIVGLFNLMDGTPYQAIGSDLQNGVGRIATQLAKWTIWILFILYFWSVRHLLDPAFLFRAYLMSIVLLASLGLLQFFVYRVTGIDIFPINREEGFTALLGETMRVTSLAGEPKRFASSLVTAIVVLFALGPMIPVRSWTRRAMVALLVSCLLLATSSSGFFTIAAAGIVLLVLLNSRVPFSGPAVRTITTLAVLMIACAYFSMAAITDLIAPHVSRSVEGLVDIIRFQTLDRLRLDDTDAVYVTFFVDNPEQLLFGVGLGLGHTSAMEYIPPHQQYYMSGTVMPPKSGVVEALVASGVLGLLLFGRAMSWIVVQGEGQSRLTPMRKLRLQSAGVALIVVASMRSYDFFTILCLLTLLKITSVQPAFSSIMGKVAYTRARRSTTAVSIPRAVN